MIPLHGPPPPRGHPSRSLFPILCSRGTETLSIPLLLAALGLAACTDLPSDPLGLDEGPTLAVTVDAPALAPVGPPVCQIGVAATGALLQACTPSTGWNGDLVAWAHGYVSPLEPLALPNDAVDGQPVAAIVTGLGYGYAASSYRDNGLVADAAVEDLDDAVAFFEGAYGAADHRFLVGASEGGLTAALALERGDPEYDAGMILCAPVGSFRAQLQYLGDFRVLLDAYFPGLVDDGNPGTPWKAWGAGGDVLIPAGVMANWGGIQAAVAAAAAAQPGRMAELLRVAGVAVDPGDPTTLVQSAAAALWYNLFATNDIIAKLGGLPYGNKLKWYRGSSNDWLLNRKVQRIAASPAALAGLAPFETDGSLTVPAVGMHTFLDPVVPFSQGLLYRWETLLAGVGFGYNFLPVSGYGHCGYRAPQVLAGFALMVLKATGWELLAPSSLFQDAEEEASFLARARELGASPTVVKNRKRE